MNSPLFTTTELYKDAERLGYGLGAYDTCGGQIDIIEAIFQVAEEMNSPAIISDGYEALNTYFGLEYFATTVNMRAARSHIPVALHLDHAFKFEYVMQAIRCGFTSVMYDGSRLSYEKNIEITRKVVEVVHSIGVSVEAELGNVGGLEGDTRSQTDKSLYTDPNVTKDFVEKTHIDSFAPAIGNAHGFYPQEPRLDFKRLRRIKEKVHIPLVLHGVTGISMDDLKKAINLGIRKINVATIVRYTYVEGLREYMRKHLGDSRNLFRRAREPLKNLIKKQIKVFGSARRKG